jgi:hypothetical protein
VFVARPDDAGMARVKQFLEHVDGFLDQEILLGRIGEFK